MRTIKIEVYKFDELSKQAKEVAIEEIRNEYYEDNDFANWAIDDCYLFEPEHKDLIDLFGDNFYNKLNKDKKYKDPPLIGNNRKNIYFNTERNSFLDCAEAMEVSNDRYFLLWLGLTDEIINGEDFSYRIFTPPYINSSTRIVFDGYKSDFDDTVMKAVKKFNDHISKCLKRIEEDIDYRFTDEAIIEDIEANEHEFLSNGKKFEL